MTTQRRSKRLDPDTKEARRHLRAFLYAMSLGRPLSADERAGFVRAFIRQKFVEIDKSFPEELGTINKLLADFEQASDGPHPILEPLAEKFAELSIRLHRNGGPRETVH